jgi:hypothetical protein
LLPKKSIKNINFIFVTFPTQAIPNLCVKNDFLKCNLFKRNRNTYTSQDMRRHQIHLKIQNFSLPTRQWMICGTKSANIPVLHLSGSIFPHLGKNRRLIQSNKQIYKINFYFPILNLIYFKKKKHKCFVYKSFVLILRKCLLCTHSTLFIKVCFGKDL